MSNATTFVIRKDTHILRIISSDPWILKFSLKLVSSHGWSKLVLQLSGKIKKKRFYLTMFWFSIFCYSFVIFLKDQGSKYSWDVRRHSDSNRNSEELWENLRSCKELLATHRNSQEFLGIPKKSLELEGTPRNSEELQGTPRNSKILLKSYQQKAPHFLDCQKAGDSWLQWTQRSHKNYNVLNLDAL